MTDEIWKLHRDVYLLLVHTDLLSSDVAYAVAYPSEDAQQIQDELTSFTDKRQQLLELIATLRHREPLFGHFATAYRRCHGIHLLEGQFTSYHELAVQVIRELSDYVCAELRGVACEWPDLADCINSDLLGELKHEAITALDAGTERRKAGGIPAEYRTRAMTKRDAARHLGRPNPDSGVRWLNKCIEDGTISCETLSQQSHIFDSQQFPAGVQATILPADVTTKAAKSR